MLSGAGVISLLHARRIARARRLLRIRRRRNVPARRSAWSRHLVRLAYLLPLLSLASISAPGCAGTLPEPIYANQVEEYFPEPGGEAPEGQAEVREQAERCAARLNGHRDTAEVVMIIQSIISGIGGAVGGVGGALAAVDFGNPDITTAMGVMSSIGGGITVVGNAIIGFFANPLEEMRLHSLGLRSWEVAVELRYGGGAPGAIAETLGRCAEDQAPPVRLVGEGPGFSR